MNCFCALRDGRATKARLVTLLRAELWPAVRTGILAALTVAVVLAGAGGPPVAVGVRVVGALLLGTLLHQAVLVAGVGALRLHRSTMATA